MKPNDFKRWRKSLTLSQKDAAEALGLKRRVVQYYEKGERDGEPVKIPRSVRLACWALAQGVTDYHGPKEREKERPAKERPAKERPAKERPAKTQRAKDKEKDKA
ncbi:MAG: helix-turn-helix domain-containing protein [Alphaproteobacteria bacterium]|nr:helix-turn-helix domain-containing protein [Alphaproteobacteria bacterium]